jgi:hypothetical protein
MVTKVVFAGPPAAAFSSVLASSPGPQLMRREKPKIRAKKRIVTFFI